jgi:hypothetical protein
VIIAAGIVLSGVTVREAEAVQPLLPSVTVTVYVPAAFTLKAAVVAPVLHRYVPPPEAVKVPEGVAQVKVKVAGAMAAVGTVLFWFTVREAVAVQPLLPSVTVTV